MASHHMTASVAPLTQHQAQVQHHYQLNNNNYYDLSNPGIMHYGGEPSVQGGPGTSGTNSSPNRRASPIISSAGQPSHGKLKNVYKHPKFGVKILGTDN